MSLALFYRAHTLSTTREESAIFYGEMCPVKSSASWEIVLMYVHQHRFWFVFE